MILEILKALGLDVPAHINALKADIDERVERTTSQVSQAALEAAVLAVLYMLAAIAALLAVGVVLIAIFWWVSDNYGDYAGLGVVFVILALAALILAMMAQSRTKLATGNKGKSPRSVFEATRATSDPGVTPQARPIVSPAPVIVSPASAAAPGTANPNISDLVQPLAALLTKVGTGRPVIAELLGGLSATGGGPVNTALDRAANVIRTGDRSNLFTVLAGAAVLGYLITHQSGRK